MAYPILFVLLLASLGPAYATEPVDQAALIRLVRQDCGSCHGMRLTGGLGTPLTADVMADKPVESMAATILYGRPGTAMPPWRGLISEAEAQWIAQKLAEGFPEESPR